MAEAPLNMDHVRIDPAWAMRVPSALALRRMVLPFALFEGFVHVACVDLNDASAFEAVERFTGNKIKKVLVEKVSLQRALNRVYGGGARGVQTGTGIKIEADDAVALSEDILHAAVIRQASDIHFEPHREGTRVRLRVDGQLEDLQMLSKNIEMAVISRLKVRAGLDIAEKRAPQDGGFLLKPQGAAENSRGIDVRVATIPTKHGERMTLRLLGLQVGTLTLENLGMSKRDLMTMENVIAQPHGLVLLTGPTGSGKTTTLYACIMRLLKEEALNVITVEDPVECELNGVSQIEVDSAEKVNFTKALRSILRHDPDVVMIGEIRDYDSLDVAVKASLTGQLVFSSLHTNSAAGAVTRLMDMGLEPFMAAATLRLCVAQRLVRRLCTHCRKPHTMTVAEAASLNDPGSAGRAIYTACGCVYCGGRGYSGRIGLFELLPVDTDFASQIVARAGEAALINTMRAMRLPLLIDDARMKIFEGETTIKEALQAVLFL